MEAGRRQARVEHRRSGVLLRTVRVLNPLAPLHLPVAAEPAFRRKPGKSRYVITHGRQRPLDVARGRDLIGDGSGSPDGWTALATCEPTRFRFRQ